MTKLQTGVLYKLPLLRKVITQILFSVLIKPCGCGISFDDKPEQTPNKTIHTTHTHTHRVLEVSKHLPARCWIWLNPQMLIQTCRCLAVVLPPLLQTSVNISDTGEMGASTPAVTVILGHKAFHLVPTGSREMLYGNTGMLYTQKSVPSPRSTSM